MSLCNHTATEFPVLLMLTFARLFLKPDTGSDITNEFVQEASSIFFENTLIDPSVPPLTSACQFSVMMITSPIEFIAISEA